MHLHTFFGLRVKYAEPPLGIFADFSQVHGFEKRAEFNLHRKNRLRALAILSDNQAAIKVLSSYDGTLNYQASNSQQ